MIISMALLSFSAQAYLPMTFLVNNSDLNQMRGQVSNGQVHCQSRFNHRQSKTRELSKKYCLASKADMDHLDSHLSKKIGEQTTGRAKLKSDLEKRIAEQDKKYVKIQENIKERLTGLEEDILKNPKFEAFVNTEVERRLEIERQKIMDEVKELILETKDN